MGKWFCSALPRYTRVFSFLFLYCPHTTLDYVCILDVNVAVKLNFRMTHLIISIQVSNLGEKIRPQSLSHDPIKNRTYVIDAELKKVIFLDNFTFKGIWYDNVYKFKLENDFFLHFFPLDFCYISFRGVCLSHSWILKFVPISWSFLLNWHEFAVSFSKYQLVKVIPNKTIYNY